MEPCRSVRVDQQFLFSFDEYLRISRKLRNLKVAATQKSRNGDIIGVLIDIW